MNPNNVNKYLYIEKTPTWLVRGLFVIGMFAWIGVILGYVPFVKLNPIFFLIVFPIVTFLIVYHLVSYFINLFYAQFDLKKHQRLMRVHEFLTNEKFKEEEVYPLVDIFLPICGEGTKVLERTFLFVSQLEYPNKKIYVLDDKGIPEHEHLAELFGFTYLSRPEKGHMKKAGNIKYGYERSEGKFIVIFDADFAPHRDFIKELIPYMDDPSVAIVQSPQYFQVDEEVHKRSPLEYGAAYVQEDFYRVIQVARDRLGAPICCGSNAIYRRTALDAIGGTVQIEHSEDMYTGFELSTRGWKVKYVPIILAVGLCPDGLHSYFHQQHRWCSGSLTLMLDKNFWNSKLSFIQKLCFISGFMYYLSYIFTIILSFQAFFILLLYKNHITLWSALPFVPCMLFTFILVRFFRLSRQRFGGYVARNAYLYSYVHASIAAFLKRSVGWQPTNIKQASVSAVYMQQLKFAAIFFLAYTALFAICIGNGAINILNINSYSLLFWIFYTEVATIIILIKFYLVLDEAKKKQATKKNEEPNFLWTWRLKTVGTYSLLVAIAFAIGMTH